jgi:endonuclease G
MLESNVKRNNRFKKDPNVITETANNSDFKGSGYDKGHLAPSADMCFSQITMEESFYFSNISPQKPGFNRGIWKSLEKETRTYAEKLQTIYVATGPILEDGLPEIGKNNVDIPNQYYKAILYVSDTCIEAVAFILPNEKIESKKLYQYAVSIDELEKRSKLNLFYNLPFFIEKRVEKNLNIQFWQNLNP